MTEAVVIIRDDDMDVRQLEDLADDLREELSTLDLESVKPGSTTAPAGTRGTEVLDFATTVIQFAIDAHIVALIADKVSQWAGRRNVQGVQITVGDARLELPGAEDDKSRDLIIDFVEAAMEAQRDS